MNMTGRVHRTSVYSFASSQSVVFYMKTQFVLGHGVVATMTSHDVTASLGHQSEGFLRGTDSWTLEFAMNSRS
jgi:hypothetical protein